MGEVVDVLLAIVLILGSVVCGYMLRRSSDRERTREALDREAQAAVETAAAQRTEKYLSQYKAYAEQHWIDYDARGRLIAQLQRRIERLRARNRSQHRALRRVGKVERG